VVRVRTNPYGFLYLDVHWQGRRTKRSLKLRDTPGQRRLAERKAAALEERLLAGDVAAFERRAPTPPRLTVRGWVETWLTKYVGRKKSGTRTKYAETLRLRWLPQFGRVPLVELTRAQLTTHLAALEVAGLKYKTVCLALDVLRTCLNAAVQDGHLPANPAARLMRFLTRPRATRAVDVRCLFSESELRTLLMTAERDFPELYPIVLVMARTGLRLGEVLLLQPGDFDFEHRRILVRRAWGRSDETEEERFHQAPKGGPAWIDASDQVCAVVQKLLTLRQAAALVDGLAPSEWLFPRSAVIRVPAAWRRLAEGATVPTRSYQRVWDRGDRPLEPPAIYQTWPRLLGQAELDPRARVGAPRADPARPPPHLREPPHRQGHRGRAGPGRDPDVPPKPAPPPKHPNNDGVLHPPLPRGQREITNRLDDHTGQTWVPVVGSPGRRHREPSRVPKPSRSAKPSRSGSAMKWPKSQ
jgi:integrase